MTGGSLAETYVTIRTDMSKLPGEMGQVRGFFGRAATDLTEKFAMTGYVMRRLIEAGKQFAFTIAEEEQAAARFAAVTEASGRGGYFTNMVRSFGQASEAMSQFDADTVRAAGTAIARFETLGDDTLLKVLKISRDITALYGGSFVNNAQLLARTLERPGMARLTLKTMHADMNAEQLKYLNALVKTGKAAEAQAYILEHAAKKSAEGTEKTAGNLLSLWERIKTQISEMSETMGAMMSPTLKTFGEQFISALRGIREQMEGGRAVGWFLQLGGSFLGLVIAGSMLVRVFGSIGHWLFGSISPTYWLVAALGTLAVKIIGIENAISLFRQPWVQWVAGLTAAYFILPRLIKYGLLLRLELIKLGAVLATFSLGGWIENLAGAGSGLVKVLTAAKMVVPELLALALAARVTGADVKLWEALQSATGIVQYPGAPPLKQGEYGGFGNKMWEGAQIEANRARAGWGKGGTPGYVGIPEFAKEFQAAVLKKDPLVGAMDTANEHLKGIEANTAEGLGGGY